MMSIVRDERPFRVSIFFLKLVQSRQLFISVQPRLVNFPSEALPDGYPFCYSTKLRQFIHSNVVDKPRWKTERDRMYNKRKMPEESKHPLSTVSPFSPPQDTVTHLRRTLEADLDAADPLHYVGPAPLKVLRRDPDAVRDLAHEKLYSFSFDQVPTCWRRCFEEASLWALLRYLERRDSDPSENEWKDWLAETVGRLDMIVIMTGAMGRRDLIDSLLELLESCCAEKSTHNSVSGGQSNEVDERPPIKKMRLSKDEESCHMKNRFITDPSPIPSFFPEIRTPLQPVLCQPIPRLNRPSITMFHSHAHSARSPIILTDTISHWPALAQWRNPRYWLRRTHGGRRLIPVELGSSYTDEGWGQKIMPFGRFMEQHLLRSRRRHDTAGETQDLCDDEEELTDSNFRTGYLAQHDLLAQIPALRNDIAIPDYCYIDPPEEAREVKDHLPNDSSVNVEDGSSEPTDLLLNIWLGPANTISPAHTDPHHNILVQVFGRKYARLFAPKETTSMYAMGCDEAGEDAGTSGAGVNMQNTSQVDVGAFVDFAQSSSAIDPSTAQASHSIEEPNGDLGAEILTPHHRRRQLTNQFPRFAEACENGRYMEAVLQPGECLYIPRGWWHYVRSLDVSASVSFWWD